MSRPYCVWHVRVDFSKQTFELPLFRGQILQPFPHCNTRVGGWECPQDSCYVFVSTHSITQQCFA